MGGIGGSGGGGGGGSEGGGGQISLLCVQISVVEKSWEGV